jgi:hypothetical protein
MKFDSIDIVEGGAIHNLTVASGPDLPSITPNAGELFFHTGDQLLYVYNGISWNAIASASDLNVTLSGDVSGSGTGYITATLASVNTSVGTFGSTGNVPVITVDAKGRITNVTTASITAGQVSSVAGRTGAVTLSQSDIAGLKTTDSPTFTGLTVTDTITGNAATTSKLLSGAAINGVTFDGSAPITITTNANTLTGTSLASNVVSSSLTSVGTLGTLTVSGTVTAGTLVGALSSGQITTALGYTPYSASNPSNFIDASGAPVQSVAGKTGAVILNQSDIGGLSTTSNVTFGTVAASTFTGALIGNATTATTLAIGRTIAASGDASGTSAVFNGSVGVTIPLTLAIVNASPVSNSFQKITVNVKGLVTSTSAVAGSDITTALGYTPANKAGDTFTGAVVLAADPAQALEAATKQYVDNLAAGLTAKSSVVTSTTAALPLVTYTNGTSGVGATLTAAANGTLGAIGGYTPANGDRILIKDQAASLQNGIYVVTDAGSAGTPFILTRAPEFDNTPTGEMAAGDFTYVQFGTLGGTQWVLTTPGTIAVGTDSITWSQLTGASVVTAGTGIAVTGNQVSNAGVLSITTSSGLSANASATGNVSITNTGVTSLTGTPNQVAVSGSTGAVTLTLPQNINSGAAPVFACTNFSAIPNGALSNSSITVNGTAISLGGTATVTADAGTLTGSSLPATVTGSSLTSVGTLGSLAVTGGVTAGSFSGPLIGNATTATNASAVNGANGQMNGDGWWRSTGSSGWYSTTYAVGIYATEAGNVRTYGGANFISAAGLQGTSLGVGTAASGTTGEIRATNNITAYYSDDRLKTRTGLIENALDKVATLDAFYYHANETAQALGYDVHPEVGISAQQVQAIMPEVVAPAPIDDKYLTVRYERLVPLLIAAIKELQAEVELLKATK